MGKLEVININTFYFFNQTLFNISLNINDKEIVCLLGRNGSGKSTIMKTIIGVLKPSSGIIKYNEEDITEKPPHYIFRMGIGYVPEDRRIFPDLTVKENLEVTYNKKRNKKNWTIERIYMIMPILKKIENRLGGFLSGGEQQLLSIARTLIGNPEILLMDEPTEGLSPLMVKLIEEIIIELGNSKIGILIGEQKIKTAIKLASRGYILNKGNIFFSGRIEEIKENEEIKSILSV